jgi:poly(A) polymerase
LKQAANWLKKTFSRLVNGQLQISGVDGGDQVPAILIPRDKHNISRANISNNAIKVLTRLSKSGYEAYLVGGGVRDLLLGREPKDFDIATNALPEEVKQVFSNCRLIGRRFRLAHVHFGREIVEVATFRSNRTTTEAGDRHVENGMILRDNVYGTLEEDAQRRDFTINALYYNIDDFSVVDFANGMSDLQQGVIRLLGDVESRYREDPVRLLRAIRFAAKLGFVIEPATEAPIAKLATLLEDVPSARLYEEVLKLFLSGAALESFEKLRHYQLFGQLFPATEEALSHEDHEFPITFVNQGMANTDDRLSQGKSVTPAFLFAVLLWEPVRLQAGRLEAEEGIHPLEALQSAAADVLSNQAKYVSIPKRFSYPMRDIWQLQARFTQRQGKRPQRLASHPKFRAAYDFLLLRAESGEVDRELADWWTVYQHAKGEEKASMTEQGRRGRGRRRRRRRKKTQTVEE